MTIIFEPLHESHFSLLLKWLETGYVKKWWDQDTEYTPDLVLNMINFLYPMPIHHVALSEGVRII